MDLRPLLITPTDPYNAVWPLSCSVLHILITKRAQFESSMKTTSSTLCEELIIFLDVHVANETWRGEIKECEECVARRFTYLFIA